MAEYRLNDPRQGIIGPVGIGTVRDLVEAGVIGPDVLVSRDGGPYLPIGSFAEIGKIQVATALPRPTYAGDLGRNSFLKMLHRFNASKLTGMLVFEDAERRKDVYLEQGVPSFVTSSIQGERFGQFLVSRGRISRQQLDAALLAMKADGNRLGATLVRLGVLNGVELLQHLHEQQVARLVELSRWERCRYAYYDTVRYDGVRLDLQLSAGIVLMRAAREISEGILLKRLGMNIDTVPKWRPGFSLVGTGLQLNESELRAVGAIDGKSTVATLAKRLGTDPASRHTILMIVYLLWEIDALLFE